MAKFYISSANSKMIVQAEDAEGAALWAVHQTLEQNESPSKVIASENNPLASWGDSISVSEQGFDRHDAGCYSTEQTLKHYVELMIALERIATIYSFDEDC